MTHDVFGIGCQDNGSPLGFLILEDVGDDMGVWDGRH